MTDENNNFSDSRFLVDFVSDLRVHFFVIVVYRGALADPTKLRKFAVAAAKTDLCITGI